MASKGFSGWARAGLAAVWGWSTLLMGCVSLPTMESFSMHPQEAPTQIVTTWQPDIIQTQDSVNNGRPLLGLGGRLYIFGKEIGKPLKVKGSVVIDLYDLSKTSSPDPVHLEQWTISPKVLEQFGRNDPLGFGYTLFLPWSTCRPEVDQILLKVRFQPVKGGFPIFTETAPMTINHPGAVAAASEMMSKEGGFTTRSFPSTLPPGAGTGNPANPMPGDATPMPGQRLPSRQTLPPPRTQPGDELPPPHRGMPGGNSGLRGNGPAEVERAGYNEAPNQENRSGAIRIPVGSAPARLSNPQSHEGGAEAPVRPYIKQPASPGIQQTGGAPPRPLYAPSQDPSARGLPLRGVSSTVAPAGYQPAAPGGSHGAQTGSAGSNSGTPAQSANPRFAIVNPGGH